MNRNYYYQERRKQEDYYNANLKGKVKNQGVFRGKPRPFVLQNGIDNLFGCIQEDCVNYFEQENITWWGENKSKHLPSGHLVSSQIHCLNHLFALRNDDIAIKDIIENATGLQIERVLASPLDKDGGYITFEFVYKNKTLLDENYETRGANCTSIDAMIYVLTKSGDKILIPIEWKYTETYQGKEAEKSSLERYPKLINEKSNLKGWSDLYKADPYYELMRQTLLMEQIIAQKDICEIEADDYHHIMIIPNGHTVLKDAIKNNYMPLLKDYDKESGISEKFCIFDPQKFLSPLNENNDYKKLLNYLKTRYWK